MKFAFIADVPWWCLSRDGTGIANAQETEHTWNVLHARSPSDFSPEDLEDYDLVRFGAVPIFMNSLNHLPSGRRSVISVCSFRDAELDLQDARIPWDRVAGVVFNDMRHAAMVERAPVKAFYFPGKVAKGQWSILPDKRPTSGLIRVGWAGSEASWPGVKNVDLLEEACELAGVKFVRQRREQDGLLDATQMERFYNGLDVYAAANIELSCTPVSVLEAMRCGVPVVTTRCGEVWPLLRAIQPELVVDRPATEEITASLTMLRFRGRRYLQELGYRIRGLSDVITWEQGEATRLTEVMAHWARMI